MNIYLLFLLGRPSEKLVETNILQVSTHEALADYDSDYTHIWVPAGTELATTFAQNTNPQLFALDPDEFGNQMYCLNDVWQDPDVFTALGQIFPGHSFHYEIPDVEEDWDEDRELE